MKTIHPAAAVPFGGVFAAAVAMATPVADVAWPRFAFPTDITDIASSFGVAGMAISGASIALLVALRDRRRSKIALALANPLTLYAFTLGPDASLAFASAALIFGALTALALDRDHGATVFLGAALAVAAMLSSSALFLAPLIVLLAPVLSPWGGARRLAGFLTAVLTPLAMCLLAVAYLHWLMGAPAPALTGAPAAAPQDIFLVMTGAALVGGAAGVRSLGGQAAAFAAGVAALAVTRPDLVATLPVR